MTPSESVSLSPSLYLLCILLIISYFHLFLGVIPYLNDLISNFRGHEFKWWCEWDWVLPWGNTPHSSEQEVKRGFVKRCMQRWKHATYAGGYADHLHLQPHVWVSDPEGGISLWCTSLLPHAMLPFSFVCHHSLLSLQSSLLHHHCLCLWTGTSNTRLHQAQFCPSVMYQCPVSKGWGMVCDERVGCDLSSFSIHCLPISSVVSLLLLLPFLLHCHQLYCL